MTPLAPDRDRLAKSNDEVKRTIDIVWTSYRSVLSKEGRLGYASTAITSGKRMYDVLDQFGVKSVDDLKAKAPTALFDSIIAPNISAGNAVARSIASRVDRPVVAPAIFEAKKQRWSQDEYMAMWLRMIEENVGEMFMSPDWEFSNGGAEEFLHAMQMASGFRSRFDIAVLTDAGKPIGLAEGTAKVANALVHLHDRGHKAPILADAFCSLLAVLGIWHAPEMGHELPPKGAYNADTLWANDHGAGSVLRLARGMEPLLKQDYGIIHPFATISADDGVPRKNDATPENIILKAEEPEAPK